MSKILAVGNAIERTDIFKAIEKGRQKFIEDTKKFKENGGLCLKCGEHPGIQIQLSTNTIVKNVTRKLKISLINFMELQ